LLNISVDHKTSRHQNFGMKLDTGKVGARTQWKQLAERSKTDKNQSTRWINTQNGGRVHTVQCIATCCKNCQKMFK